MLNKTPKTLYIGGLPDLRNFFFVTGVTKPW